MSPLSIFYASAQSKVQSEPSQDAQQNRNSLIWGFTEALRAKIETLNRSIVAVQTRVSTTYWIFPKIRITRLENGPISIKRVEVVSRRTEDTRENFAITNTTWQLHFKAIHSLVQPVFDSMCQSLAFYAAEIGVTLLAAGLQRNLTHGISLTSNDVPFLC